MIHRHRFTLLLRRPQKQPSEIDQHRQSDALRLVDFAARPFAAFPRRHAERGVASAHEFFRAVEPELVGLQVVVERTGHVRHNGHETETSQGATGSPRPEDVPGAADEAEAGSVWTYYVDEGSGHPKRLLWRMSCRRRSCVVTTGAPPAT